MESKVPNRVKSNLHKVKKKTGKRFQNPMKDPTLEGKDENKVGRIPEKSTAVD